MGKLQSPGTVADFVPDPAFVTTITSVHPWTVSVPGGDTHLSLVNRRRVRSCNTSGQAASNPKKKQLCGFLFPAAALTPQACSQAANDSYYCDGNKLLRKTETRNAFKTGSNLGENQAQGSLYSLSGPALRQYGPLKYLRLHPVRDNACMCHTYILYKLILHIKICIRDS